MPHQHGLPLHIISDALHYSSHAFGEPTDVIFVESVPVYQIHNYYTTADCSCTFKSSLIGKANQLRQGRSSVDALI